MDGRRAAEERENEYERGKGRSNGLEEDEFECSITIQVKIREWKVEMSLLDWMELILEGRKAVLRQ